MDQTIADDLDRYSKAFHLLTQIDLPGRGLALPPGYARLMNELQHTLERAAASDYLLHTYSDDSKVLGITTARVREQIREQMRSLRQIAKYLEMHGIPAVTTFFPLPYHRWPPDKIAAKVQAAAMHLKDMLAHFEPFGYTQDHVDRLNDLGTQLDKLTTHRGMTRIERTSAVVDARAMRDQARAVLGAIDTIVRPHFAADPDLMEMWHTLCPSARRIGRRRRLGSGTVRGLPPAETSRQGPPPQLLAPIRRLLGLPNEQTQEQTPKR